MAVAACRNPAKLNLAVQENGLGDRALEEKIKPEIEPIIRGLGFALVELKVGLSHQNAHVTAVVYRQDGVGIDDLSKINKICRPNLELFLAAANLTFEVSSPGIDRKLKSVEEYSIFKGKGVKLLLQSDSAWEHGVIEQADAKTLWLNTAHGTRELELAEIKKAKLDYTQEVISLNHVC